MDFELSDDQVALTEGIAALCAGRFDIETVRGLEAGGGVNRALWSELGQTGKCAIPSSSDTIDRKRLSELTSIQISRSSNTSLKK